MFAGRVAVKFRIARVGLKKKFYGTISQNWINKSFSVHY